MSFMNRMNRMEANVPHNQQSIDIKYYKVQGHFQTLHLI